MQQFPVTFRPQQFGGFSARQVVIDAEVRKIGVFTENFRSCIDENDFFMMSADFPYNLQIFIGLGRETDEPFDSVRTDVRKNFPVRFLQPGLGSPCMQNRRVVVALRKKRLYDLKQNPVVRTDSGSENTDVVGFSRLQTLCRGINTIIEFSDRFLDPRTRPAAYQLRVLQIA